MDKDLDAEDQHFNKGSDLFPFWMSWRHISIFFFFFLLLFFFLFPSCTSDGGIFVFPCFLPPYFGTTNGGA